MTNKTSAENTINPEGITTDELQDPMSGYTSADALPASDAPTQETHGAERLRDPMSGYTGGDAVKTDSIMDPPDVDRIHTEESKDSMSGYASADALDPKQK